jgi:hypothetical protein
MITSGILSSSSLCLGNCTFANPWLKVDTVIIWKLLCFVSIEEFGEDGMGVWDKSPVV